MFAKAALDNLVKVVNRFTPAARLADALDVDSMNGARSNDAASMNSIKWLVGNSRRFLSALNVGFIGALTLIWIFALYEVHRERDAAIRDASLQTTIQAQVFAEYTRSTIRRIDETLLDLRSKWTGDSAAFTETVMRRHVIVSDIGFQIGVIDRDGLLAYYNHSVPKQRVDLRDREHYKVHAEAGDADRLFISDALKGKVSQKWSIYFTRPLLVNGRFDGVIVLSIGPEHFASFSNNLNVSLGGVITVVKDSGRMIARQPLIEDALDLPLRDAPFLLASAPESGSFQRYSQSDGTERIYGFYRMPEYGLTTAVGVPVERALAPYRAHREATLRIAAIITALLCVLYNVMRRSGAERRRADDQRRIASLVYEASSEGMVVTSAEGRIIAVNPAFSSLTGYSPEEVVGKTPALLQSGRHDAQFYARMWEQIHTSGHWQGEVWNRRKNGEIYPQWLTINTTADAKGSLVRRVGLFSDISEKKKTEELIWQQANFDALTGLPNRRMFSDRLDMQIKRAQRSRLPFALLLLDLDRFKEVNDSLGHHVGDLLLKEVAARLRSCVRELDTVARLGGDEFTVILGEPCAEDGVQRVVDSIQRSIGEPFHLGGEVVFTTPSVGVAFYPRDATDADSLTKHADQAMFAAKALGPNRCSFFTAAMQDAIQSRTRLVTDLRVALAESQFTLHYQPIVDLATGRVCRAEALLRWTHPKRGPISPAAFISVAEDTGMIIDIGDWVFRQALDDMVRWKRILATPIQVGVNMSPLQLRDPKAAVATWPKRIKERGISERSLIIEITENSLMEEHASVATHLAGLREAGMQLSLDDFGTGYSSLAYLKKFPIDYLKIDQSFVQTLNSDSRDNALCEAIIVMAHKIGIRVVAEGVETQAQLDFLRAAGCDFAQGYLISRPIPRDHFEAWVLHEESLTASKVVPSLAS